MTAKTVCKTTPSFFGTNPHRMIKCLLVDDESPAIRLLENYIRMRGGLEVVATCHSAIEAMDILKKEAIDLMFLDIHMPLLSGLDFLKTVKHLPRVIITTAHREHALEGYNLDVVDYLLKPIPFERFVKAIERYEERANPRSSAPTKPEAAFFYVNVNKKNIKVVYDDILYVESLKDYVRIHLKEQRLIVKSNIGKIYDHLPQTKFLRVHRSFVVSLSKITAFTQRDVEIGEKEIPIGPSYLREVTDQLKQT